MTKIVKVKTGSKLEEISSYSRLVCVDNWIFVSNTAGRNPETKEIPEDVLEQTHQVFSNVEAALKAVGASLADVVMSRVFIQNPADTQAVMTVTCPPLGSTIYKMELEVTAFRGASSAEIEVINTAN